jgi:hypothetical protein
MHSQAESDNSNRFTITLEIVPDDPLDADPALVDAVGRDATDALRNDGYTIEPVYTGQRGGDFLVNVVMPVLASAWTQKDLILADGSALITLFTPVVSLAKHLHEAHERRVGKDAAQQSPIKITVEIDGASISIEAPDLENAQGAIKLAQRFQMQHPTIASQVTNQSKAKLKAGVSKRPLRKRR